MTTPKEKRKQDALAAFSELIDIIDTLRSPGGCPWDRRQTSESLKPYLVEETYEALDAIDSGVSAHVQEELGDVLLQIMLHAQIAYESDDFHIGDVVRRLSRKMIQRHPHVFADAEVDDVADVLRNWEQIKAEEKQDKGLLDGVPRALPGLLRAYRVGQKTSRVGFDWSDVGEVRLKVTEELAELDEAIALNDKIQCTHEFGDVLFAVAQWARHAGVDPEDALRQCCDRFGKRFSFVESAVKQSAKPFGEYSLDELESLWQRAKKNERTKRTTGE